MKEYGENLFHISGSGDIGKILLNLFVESLTMAIISRYAIP
jgi:hypothetical protein